ncbi:MAG TPA: hypothetical protein VET46_15905 [Steroidobacteraceae bacterium]|nr:hypothetical protein [Steroidobacteraceae bacterium]
MTCRTVRSPLPSITVRLSTRDKEWFTTLARSRGVSESALALSVIRSISDSGCFDSYATGPRTPATDRVTIRLRPGDGQAIGARASKRGMKPSTYLAALVRAHLSANPPLPAKELATLKQSIAVLAGLGTVLAQTARNPALSGPALEDVRQAISRARAALAALEQRTHEFTRQALISWESERV